MSDGNANDNDKFKALLTRYNFTELATERGSRRPRQRLKERQTSLSSICRNYLAKWLEFSGSSYGDFDALVDLIVKEQFINACSEELPARERTQGPGRVKADRWSIFKVKRFFCNVVIYYP